MDLVLDKKVNQRDQCAKEATGKVFPVLDRFRIRWAQGNAPGGPRNGKDEVRDHQYVMPVMVVGRGDVTPPSAC